MPSPGVGDGRGRANLDERGGGYSVQEEYVIACCTPSCEKGIVPMRHCDSPPVSYRNRKAICQECELVIMQSDAIY